MHSKESKALEVSMTFLAFALLRNSSTIYLWRWHTPSTQKQYDLKATTICQNLDDVFAFLIFYAKALEWLNTILIEETIPVYSLSSTMSKLHFPELNNTICYFWIQNSKCQISCVSLIATWEYDASSHMLQSTWSTNAQNVKWKIFHSDVILISF